MRAHRRDKLADSSETRGFMMPRFITSLIFSFLFVSASFPLASAEVPGYSAAGIEKLRSDIQEILDEEGIPGASVTMVSRDGTIWAGGVGKADIAADRDVTANSLFRVGSISKSFTALGLLSLVEQGRLDLNTPVRDLAPELEFTNPWSDTHPVTVAHVMEHTTGWDDIHFREYAKTDDPDMTLEEGLAYNPGSRISRWVPGTHMSYCNSGPPVAALVLQEVTGEEFEDYAQEHIFKPLGMSNSAYGFPVEADLLAKGYEEDGETEANYDHIIVRPSGALNASAAGMGNYLQMMINRGTFQGNQLFKPETITRMETPTTTLAAEAGHDFGYGLGNYSSVVAGHQFHGHDGGITGFVSTSAYSSELGLGYFISINKISGKLRDIAELVGEFLTTNYIPTVPAVAELSVEELDAVAGYYQDVTPRQQIMYFFSRFMSIQKVAVENGKLQVSGLYGGEKTELIPVSNNSFRGEEEPVATKFLVTDDSGNTYLQGNMGGNMKQISAFWAWFQPVIAALSVLLMLSAILFAIVWIPAKLFGKLKSIPLRIVLLPFLASLSLFAAFGLPILIASNITNDLGIVSPVSLTIFAGTLVFAALTVLLLFRMVRRSGPPAGRFVRIHSSLVTMACTITMIYLWSNDILGIRLWAY
jgi:CubicO group peptidase (beta-lactamase class C family)